MPGPADARVRRRDLAVLRGAIGGLRGRLRGRCLTAPYAGPTRSPTETSGHLIQHAAEGSNEPYAVGVGERRGRCLAPYV